MNKTDLSKFNNDWYKNSSLTRGFLITFLWFVTNRIFLNSYLPIPMSVKKTILKVFGAKIGTGLTIKPMVNVKAPWNLAIGDNVWVGEGVWIDNIGKVRIGNNVCISQGAMLLSGNHDYKKETFDLIIKDIILEDGVWIGAKSIVCTGVTCFSHAVLSVNSVATHNLDTYRMYQGNPAKVVRERIIAI
jgi:putative colanic acid biosynthesis acetyltransferase WcaF